MGGAPKLCADIAQLYGTRNAAVSAVAPIPGTGNIRIRDCVNAPSKGLAVVEVEEGGVDGGLAQDALHVLIDLAAHIAA